MFTIKEKPIIKLITIFLDRTYKALTKCGLEEIGQTVQTQQQKNMSTIDAIYIVKQIADKLLEYDQLAYMYLIDIIKTLDRVCLIDVIKILREKGINLFR